MSKHLNLKTPKDYSMMEEELGLRIRNFMRLVKMLTANLRP